MEENVPVEVVLVDGDTAQAVGDIVAEGDLVDLVLKISKLSELSLEPGCYCYPCSICLRIYAASSGPQPEILSPAFSGRIWAPSRITDRYF